MSSQKPTFPLCVRSYSLEKEVPVADVAELAGDTETVIRKYYTKWIPELEVKLANGNVVQAGDMEKQCLKCNSIARDDAGNCEVCGAPFGAIPSTTGARRILLWISLALVVALLVVLLLMQTR